MEKESKKIAKSVAKRIRRDTKKKGKTPLPSPELAGRRRFLLRAIVMLGP
ncbi:DUF4175 domain-containing protein [Paenibacillus cucumis (ex Kampfer et al. 2016)]|uniref:Uncharacterized protein n=1 Tax=Paenibacillus cucumis (ex Kampfer et al. 2016) TaxID=1776858 RepID=A0ABS7KEL2_9BACL|nr:DUF4175 domain-containing protein [Paenibacillus cucumis (ex Kampfer et al. 2016)]MBY0202377.1 hypothetical protein [Paenibacillus cucumis (ex Kampfer et al. 2016)]